MTAYRDVALKARVIGLQHASPRLFRAIIGLAQLLYLATPSGTDLPLLLHMRQEHEAPHTRGGY